MATTDDPSGGEAGYFHDPESAAEMARDAQL